MFDGTRWLRQAGPNRRELNKDPFAQAQNAMHEVANVVKNRHTRGLLFTFGFAVAFPDSKFKGPTPASVQTELILDADRLGTVSKAIHPVVRRFARRDHRSMRPEGVEFGRAALYPKDTLVTVLWRKIEIRRSGCKG